MITGTVAGTDAVAGTGTRSALSAAERVVVKVGSAVITNGDAPCAWAVGRLARDIAALRAGGREVVVVLSGAVAAGYAPLGLEHSPRDVVARQAAASVGQPRLMALVSKSFARHELEIAQLLMSADDVENRRRFLSARHTIRTLLERGVVPVINENDALADDEAKVGDNDHLAALVASLVTADLLVILSQVDGVRRDRGRGALIACADDAETLHEHVHGGTSATGVGGMGAKISAARLAAERGVATVIADGRRDGTLPRVLAGEPLGTLVQPAPGGAAARRAWITIRSRTRGRIVVDASARQAIVEGGDHVRPRGVVAVEGSFPIGARVEVCDAAHRVIGVGLASYAAHEIRRMQGQSHEAFDEVLGYHYVDAVILREDLVVREGLEPVC